MNLSREAHRSLGFKLMVVAGCALLSSGCGTPEAVEPRINQGAPSLLDTLPQESAGARSWIQGGALRDTGFGGYGGHALVAYDDEGHVVTVENADVTGEAKVRKLAPDGSEVFSRSFRAPPYSTMSFRVLEVDAAGNILLTGRANGPWDLLGGVSGQDSFIAKLDPSGNRLWGRYTRPAAGTRFEFRGLAVKAGGEIVAISVLERLSDETGKVMITQYDGQTGAPQWDRILGPDTSEAYPWQPRAMSIAVDDADNIYLAGDVTDGIDFGNAVLTSDCTRIECRRGFLASLDAAGNHRWSRLVNGSPGELVLRGSVAAVAIWRPRDAENAGPRNFLMAWARETGAERWSHLISRDEFVKPFIASTRDGEILVVRNLGDERVNARYQLSRFLEDGSLASTFTHQSPTLFQVLSFDAAPRGKAIAVSGTYQESSPDLNVPFDPSGWHHEGQFTMQVVTP